jgi:hypothetical protein
MYFDAYIELLAASRANEFYMEFTIDGRQNGKTVINPLWEQVADSLRQIDADTCCFFILTSDTGSYLQCAGGRPGVTLEFRVVLSDTFKHFVLGKGLVKSALETIWSTIECRIGPIRVHKDEVFTLDEAIDCFMYFFHKSDLPPGLAKRNVTKHFYV